MSSEKLCLLCFYNADSLWRFSTLMAINTPCIKDCENIKCSGRTKTGAKRLYTAAGMPSGPAAEFASSRRILCSAWTLNLTWKRLSAVGPMTTSRYDEDEKFRENSAARALRISRSYKIAWSLLLFKVIVWSVAFKHFEKCWRIDDCSC